MKRRPLVMGVLLLSAAGVFTRMIGAVYRVFLVRLIGAEGIGLVQMVFPLFNFASTLGTLGIPAALARTLSGTLPGHNWRRAEQAIRISWLILIPAATVIAIGVWLSAGWISHRLLTDPRVYLSLLALPFAIWFSSVAWLLRGYFQGLQQLTPNAVATVIEQLARVAFVLVFAWLLLPYGLGAAAAGAVFGMAIGEASGLLYLYWLYIRDRQRQRLWKKSLHAEQTVSEELAHQAMPILLHRLLGSLGSMIEVWIIPTRLMTAGFNATQATALYGQLNGMVLPLLFLPTVLIFPITTAILPAVSDASARNAGQDQRLLQRRLRLSFGATLGIGLISGLIFFFFPELLSSVLYDAPEIAPLVVLTAPIAPLAYLSFTAGTVINGLGHPTYSLIHHLIGMCVKFPLLWTLTANPRLGVAGALIAVMAGYCITSLLNTITVPFLVRKLRNTRTTK